MQIHGCAYYLFRYCREHTKRFQGIQIKRDYILVLKSILKLLNTGNLIMQGFRLRGFTVPAFMAIFGETLNISRQWRGESVPSSPKPFKMALSEPF